MMDNQRTIDSFFKCKSDNGKEYYVKKYFYLDWSKEGAHPIEDAQWLFNKPKHMNFCHKVTCDFIKKGYFFYICGYFEEYETHEFQVSKEKKYKNSWFLKSHLQKTVRMMDDQRALPTAMHLMQLDINEFLRRMTVIHLEDTFLHQSWTTLLWLMIALPKKFKMKKYIYEWMLGFVYITCITKKKDDCHKKLKGLELLKKYKNIFEELNSYHDMKLSKNQESILYSLHIRCAFGGMGCDIIMIENYIKLWKTRFINKSMCITNVMKIRPISIFMNDLPLENWDLRSIDYHCQSKFNEYILKKYPELGNLETINKIIWIHNSGLNKRLEENENYKKMNEYKKDEWLLIKKYVQRMQRYFLTCNY